MFLFYYWLSGYSSESLSDMPSDSILSVYGGFIALCVVFTSF